MMFKMNDLTGMRCGTLTAIRPAGFSTNAGNIMWVSKCDCGNERIVIGSDFKRGRYKSCGCLGRRRKYGKDTAKSMRLWHIHNSILVRCRCETNKKYADYGGRGITVCDEWLHSFESFRDWAVQNGYADDLSIDRIDVNGNYCPENCRWATNIEQQNNKRNNHTITCDGRTMTIAEWARELGVRPTALRQRLVRGWSDEQTIKMPVKKYKRRMKDE